MNGSILHRLLVTLVAGSLWIPAYSGDFNTSEETARSWASKMQKILKNKDAPRLARLMPRWMLFVDQKAFSCETADPKHWHITPKEFSKCAFDSKHPLLFETLEECFSMNSEYDEELSVFKTKKGFLCYFEADYKNFRIAGVSLPKREPSNHSLDRPAAR